MMDNDDDESSDEESTKKNTATSKSPMKSKTKQNTEKKVKISRDLNKDGLPPEEDGELSHLLEDDSKESKNGNEVDDFFEIGVQLPL